MSVTTRVERVRTVEAIPAAEWAALEGGVCPLWAREIFITMERSAIADGFEYIVVWRYGRCVAVLPVFWFHGFPIDEALGGRSRRAAARVRRRLPRFGRVSLLACGHPLAEGRLLGAVEGDEAAQVMREIRTIAVARRLSWILFKGFDSASLVEHLPQVGNRPYFSGPALPDAIVDLPRDVEAYLARLRPKARRNLRSKLRKFARERNLRVEVIDEWRPLVEEVVELYDQVFANADARFERLPRPFFDTLATGDADAPLIACWEGDRLIGCLVCLVSADRCVSFRIGLDYEHARKHNLWFILQYEAARLAIDRGCEQLNLLQTTYPAKRELGCRLDAPANYFRHRSALLSTLLRAGAPELLRMSVETALEA